MACGGAGQECQGCPGGQASPAQHCPLPTRSQMVDFCPATSPGERPRAEPALPTPGSRTSSPQDFEKTSPAAAELHRCSLRSPISALDLLGPRLMGVRGPRPHTHVLYHLLKTSAAWGFHSEFGEEFLKLAFWFSSSVFRSIPLSV